MGIIKMGLVIMQILIVYCFGCWKRQPVKLGVDIIVSAQIQLHDPVGKLDLCRRLFADTIL